MVAGKNKAARWLCVIRGKGWGQQGGWEGKRGQVWGHRYRPCGACVVLSAGGVGWGTQMAKPNQIKIHWVVGRQGKARKVGQKNNTRGTRQSAGKVK